MAYNYNPYFNNTNQYYGSPYYQRPYQIPSTPIGTMQQQTQQYPPQYETPIHGVKFLTADEIKAYIVLPSTTEILVDRANNVAHLKSADNMGQSSSRIFRLEEITEAQIGEKPIKNEDPKIDTSVFVKADDLKSYITKDEVAEFLTKDDLKDVNAKIEQLQKQVKINDILKGDDKVGK